MASSIAIHLTCYTGDDETTDDRCSICGDKSPTNRFQCCHSFCKYCFKGNFVSDVKCPSCIHTNTRAQPENGQMTFTVDNERSFPGYTPAGTIVITYEILPGKQDKDYQNPGESYEGTKGTTYLPNTAEGRKMHDLLKKAFDARLVFSLERSDSLGKSKYVMWNGISHKTNIDGRIEKYMSCTRYI